METAQERTEIRRLAKRLTGEENPMKSDEILRISSSLRHQLSRYFSVLSGDTESIPRVKSTNKLLQRLKARLGQSRLSTFIESNISWADVEKALRAAPELLSRIREREKYGGKPYLREERNDGYLFADSKDIDHLLPAYQHSHDPRVLGATWSFVETPFDPLDLGGWSVIVPKVK